MEYTHVVHPFAPLFDENSKVLVLGSFPSVKSREQAFFYGHPQNRYWKVIAAVLHESVPVTVGEKRALMLKHGIAMYDVIHECDIVGSSDASIRNAVASDLSPILRGRKLPVFTNGNTARNLYQKYIFPVTGIETTGLPSTSPANAAWSVDRLIEAWSVVADALGE